MDLIDVMHTYFRGERMVGYAVVPLGLAFLAGAFFVWRSESGGFMWGLAVPLALVGLLALIGGPGLVWRTGGQVAALDAGLAPSRETGEPSESRAETLRDERARMAKVDANWPRLKIVWAVVAVSGLVLLFFVRREWALGLGLALMILAATGFVIDVFAERRAAIYSRALAAAE